MPSTAHPSSAVPLASNPTMNSTPSLAQVYETSSELMASKEQPGNLYPTTSTDTGRYEKSAKVDPQHTVVDAGMFLSTRAQVPQYLPPNWSACIHPEGDVYFHRNASLAVVTDECLYQPETAVKVTAWISRIEKQFVSKDIAPSDNMELYVKLDEEDCFYYIVDHDSKTLFWLDEYDTEDLNILRVVSPSHLKVALEDKYWNHVQTFPMHIGGLPPKLIDDLICVFSHATADHMTSNVSTFPYDATTCMKFVKLLKSSKDHIEDGHTTCFVARLWGIVVNNRYWTHYGQEHARLSRDQSILVNDTIEPLWSRHLTSALSLKACEKYRTHLNELYVDHYVYESQWRSFMASTFSEWRNTSQNAVYLLLLHIPLLFVSLSPVLATVSGALLSVCLLTSALLMYRHEELEKGTATDAHCYLSAVRSNKFKFQWVAFSYSLPKALYFWGLLTFFSQWIVILTRQFSTGLAAGIIGVLALALLAFHSVTSESALSCPLYVPRFFSRFQTANAADDKLEESMV